MASQPTPPVTYLHPLRKQGLINGSLTMDHDPSIIPYKVLFVAGQWHGGWGTLRFPCYKISASNFLSKLLESLEGLSTRTSTKCVFPHGNLGKGNHTGGIHVSSQEDIQFKTIHTISMPNHCGNN